MGCFDYTCNGCNGNMCNHRGLQNCEAHVVIEVPLSNGKTVHLKGYYEEYGYVIVMLDNEEYEFYLIEFQEYFKDWIQDKSEKQRRMMFIASKVYTVSDDTYYSDDKREIEYLCAKHHTNPIEFTKNILSKCIRVCKDLDLPSYEEELKLNIEKCESKIKAQQKKLEIYKKELEQQLKLNI